MEIEGLDVRIDPFEVDYGPQLPLQLDEEPEATIDPEVERGAAEWGPVVPPADHTRFERLVFVDGVRRLEARLVVRDADGIGHGAFGSWAVGSVACDGERATFGEPLLGRVVALGSGRSLSNPVSLGPALVYEPDSTAAIEPDAPLKVIHTQMRSAEERLGREIADRRGTLAILDGPLSFQHPVRGWAVGFIKRLHRTYLEPELFGVAVSLPVGARTPVFLMRGTRFGRYSWFGRIAAPAPAEARLTGVVRMEVAEAVGVADAVTLANATTAALPRFVPSKGRDPRAPQNLLPIGALEAMLRRRLGDARIARRRVEDLLAKGTSNAA